MITIGSLFSGIGSFELGLERAIPNAKTIWQVENDTHCQRILKKHWKNSLLFNDVRNVGAHNLSKADIITAGFPCTDISLANRDWEGLNGKKSSLWWEAFRITSELRPRVLVLENVPAITVRGLPDILAALSSIGYDSEWAIIQASRFGAPHHRRRFFLVSYPADTHCSSLQEQSIDSKRMESNSRFEYRSSKDERLRPTNYWKRTAPPPEFCRMDDGIRNRVDRIRILGNSIVPACSEYIGSLILKSGLL